MTIRIWNRNGIRSKGKSVMNRYVSVFYLPLSDFRIQSELWRYSQHKIAEGKEKCIGKSHDFAEKYFGNQRLAIRFGAGSIRNERADRYIARSDRSLLIHAEIRRNRCAKDSGRWWNVGDSGVVHCFVCGQERDKNYCRCRITLIKLLLQ